MMEHNTRPTRRLKQRKYLYIILPAFVGSVIAYLDRVFSWRVPVSCLLAGSSRVFDAHPEREPGEPVNLLFSRQYSIM
jgi:hypothetical protein